MRALSGSKRVHQNQEKFSTVMASVPVDDSPSSVRPKKNAVNYNVERIIGLPAGILSGATKLLVGHPFDTVKVRMQTEGGFGRFKGPLDCLLQTIRKEGFRALYKGATPPLIGWSLMDSTQMLTLTNLRVFFRQYNDAYRNSAPLSLGQHSLAGLGAGLVVSFVATPVELLKGKLQIQYEGKGKRAYNGPVDCAKKLVSGLAATTFWIIAFPADLVKNKIMTQPDPGRGAPLSAYRYPSMYSCAKDIVAKGIGI
ncbi:hypothetical protein HDU67_001674 [Dinochytrium kinnereticum]|nr:hypothetical protein HDU67_001674 [Dinochytrium kinnereticum]